MNVTPSSALALRCAPLPIVHIGFVGLGRRGMATLRRYQDLEGVCVTALADLSESRVAEAKSWLAETQSSDGAVQTFVGDTAVTDLLACPSVDVVYICTDWASHTPIAVAAMRAGKHVAVEVPAATSLDECWQLVRTAEETQRHCFMTENCCYDWFALCTRSLYNSGVFGTLTHAEGAYLHDWRKFFGASATASYQQGALHGGNPYPTHGIGPIGQLLRDNGDRMLRLVAVTGQAVGEESALGHVNSALITTAKGVTILLQFDCTTPRPYSRLQTLCGTEAFAQKYPTPTLQIGETIWTNAEAETRLWEAPPTPQLQLWQEGQARGVENPMNYAMDARFIACLQAGLPLDIDVYDAAEWSCLAELTRISAQQGGVPVEIPQFRN